MSNYDFIKAGSKVFWHDPDGGLSDGVYQVVDVPEEIEEDSIILIASDYSEAEVFAAELSPLRFSSGGISELPDMLPVPPILLYDLWKIYLLYLSNITFFYTHL